MGTHLPVFQVFLIDRGTSPCKEGMSPIGECLCTRKLFGFKEIMDIK